VIATLQALDYACYEPTGGIQLLWLIPCDKAPAIAAVRKVKEDVLSESLATQKLRSHWEISIDGLPVSVHNRQLGLFVTSARNRRKV
jgi:hypothetical protein